jgi:excalibur calcium-binding domain-containing protein
VLRTALPLIVAIAFVLVLVLATPASAGRFGSAPTAPAAAPALFKNCTALNKKYPHGVGKAKARDKTSGEPVTTFKRSTALYNRAMSYNKRLDGDKDGSPARRRERWG